MLDVYFVDRETIGLKIVMTIRMVKKEDEMKLGIDVFECIYTILQSLNHVFVFPVTIVTIPIL